MFICISKMDFEMDLSSQQCVDLLLNGLKFVEGISFPKRRILHNIEIHDLCISVNLTKILNVDLPYPLEGPNTFP